MRGSAETGTQSQPKIGRRGVSGKALVRFPAVYPLPLSFRPFPNPPAPDRHHFLPPDRARPTIPLKNRPVFLILWHEIGVVGFRGLGSNAANTQTLGLFFWAFPALIQNHARGWR